MAPVTRSQRAIQETKQTAGSTLDGASRPPRLKPSRTNPPDATETQGGVEAQAPIAQDAETWDADNRDTADRDNTEIQHAYHMPIDHADTDTDADSAEHAVSEAAGQPETLPRSYSVDAVQQGQVQAQGQQATTSFSFTGSPGPSSEHEQQQKSRDDEYREFIAERLPSIYPSPPPSDIPEPLWVSPTDAQLYLGQQVLRLMNGYGPSRPPQTTFTSKRSTRSKTTTKSANVPSANTAHPTSRPIPTPSLDTDSGSSPSQAVSVDEHQSGRHVELKSYSTTRASTPVTTEDEYDSTSIATTSPESEVAEFLQLLSLSRPYPSPVQTAEARWKQLDPIDAGPQTRFGVRADNVEGVSGSLSHLMDVDDLAMLSDSESDLHVGGQAFEPDTEPAPSPKPKWKPMTKSKPKPKKLAEKVVVRPTYPYPPTAGHTSQVEYESDANEPDNQPAKDQRLVKHDKRKRDTEESTAITEPSKVTQESTAITESSKMDIECEEILKVAKATVIACIRCRMMKQKCLVDKDDPEGDCLPCKNVCKTSPRLYRRVICVRCKLNDIILFRRSGLKLTARWLDVCMKDVADRFPKEATRTIYLSLGLCKEPIQLEVVRFKPKKGDVTARYWTDYSSGRPVRRKKELATYCLADIHATAARVEEYIVTNALHGMVQAVEKNKGCKEAGSPFAVTERTTGMAVTRFLHLCEMPPTERRVEDDMELRLLGNTLILWFAIQHSTGSSHIEGEETLGMERETTDPSYPMQGKISTPRMIIAQFDNLNYLRILQKYRCRVLAQLFTCMSQPRTKWWFTVYTVFFILLREASWNCQDRQRHARANFGTRLRYSIPGFVEDLQDGCNNLLAHWHYFRGVLPRGNRPTTESLKAWANLTDEQSNLIQLTRDHPEVRRHLAFWKQYEKSNGSIRYDTGHQPVLGSYNGSQTKFNWDEPHYWTSQLLDPEWTPHPTYQREPEI